MRLDGVAGSSYWSNDTHLAPWGSADCWEEGRLRDRKKEKKGGEETHTTSQKSTAFHTKHIGACHGSTHRNTPVEGSIMHEHIHENTQSMLSQTWSEHMPRHICTLTNILTHLQMVLERTVTSSGPEQEILSPFYSASEPVSPSGTLSVCSCAREYANAVGLQSKLTVFGNTPHVSTGCRSSIQDFPFLSSTILYPPIYLFVCPCTCLFFWVAHVLSFSSFKNRPV